MEEDRTSLVNGQTEAELIDHLREQLRLAGEVGRTLLQRNEQLAEDNRHLGDECKNLREQRAERERAEREKSLSRAHTTAEDLYEAENRVRSAEEQVHALREENRELRTKAARCLALGEECELLRAQLQAAEERALANHRALEREQSRRRILVQERKDTAGFQQEIADLQEELNSLRLRKASDDVLQELERARDTIIQQQIENEHLLAAKHERDELAIATKNLLLANKVFQQREDEQLCMLESRASTIQQLREQLDALSLDSSRQPTTTEQPSLLDDLLDLSELPDVSDSLDSNVSVVGSPSPPPPPPFFPQPEVCEETDDQANVANTLQNESSDEKAPSAAEETEHLSSETEQVPPATVNYLLSVLTFRQQGEDAQTTVLSSKMQRVLDLSTLLRMSSTILRELIAASKNALGEQGELKLTSARTDPVRDLYCQALELIIENAQLRLDANETLARAQHPRTAVNSSSSTTPAAATAAATASPSTRDGSWFTSWF